MMNNAPFASLLIGVACVFAFLSSYAADSEIEMTSGSIAKVPFEISLWPDEGPAAVDLSDAKDAKITLYRPEQPNGVAILICPGGGYEVKVSEPEGHLVGRWLNKHGITGAVLDYRLPKTRSEVPLRDALRAMSILRQSSSELGLESSRIGCMGFSAGGHLAASLATLGWKESEANAPDFAILVYPVISMQEGLAHQGSRENLLGKAPSKALVTRFSLEMQVTEKTPPVFLAHAIDDILVPVENSRGFAASMREKGRQVKLLELDEGGHGLNGYQGPNWEAWKMGALDWMAELKFLP